MENKENIFLVKIQNCLKLLDEIEDTISNNPIVRLDTHGNLIDRWENAREIQRTLGIDFRFVSRCCNHKCKTAHGYIFMFEGEYDDK